MEKRLWDLVKVNRRKAREGGGVKKGFFAQPAQTKAKPQEEEKKKGDEEEIEEIANPGLPPQSLDQNLREEAERKAKKIAGGETANDSSPVPAKEEEEKDPEEDEGKGLVPNSGNGYTFDDGRSWVQSLQDVTYTIPVPANTKARDCTVTITKTHLKVGLKSQAPDLIIDMDLHKEIQTEDSFWNISKPL